MRLKLLLLLCFFPMTALAQSVFNCSAFNANPSGACSVATASGRGSQQFIVRNNTTPISSPPQMQIVPPNAGHNGFGAFYFNTVNITAFTTTFLFIPNGQNLAFVAQNTNSQSPDEGDILNSGAGC